MTCARLGIIKISGAGDAGTHNRNWVRELEAWANFNPAYGYRKQHE